MSLLSTLPWRAYWRLPKRRNRCQFKRPAKRQNGARPSRCVRLTPSPEYTIDAYEKALVRALSLGRVGTESKGPGLFFVKRRKQITQAPLIVDCRILSVERNRGPSPNSYAYQRPHSFPPPVPGLVSGRVIVGLTASHLSV